MPHTPGTIVLINPKLEMSSMAVEFVAVDRDTPALFPPSVQEYVPEKHLARFVVEIVDQLDLSHLVAAYCGTGPKPYHPAMLVALLFYRIRHGGVLQPQAGTSEL